MPHADLQRAFASASRHSKRHVEIVAGAYSKNLMDWVKKLGMLNVRVSPLAFLPTEDLTSKMMRDSGSHQSIRQLALKHLDLVQRHTKVVVNNSVRAPLARTLILVS
jgi:hypothetical protein